MRTKPSMSSSLRTSFAPIFLFAGLIALSGCGRGSNSPSTGLPVTPPAGQTNSYVGQPGNSPSQTSLWNVTIDRSANTYSFGPISGSGTATSGSIATLSNVSNFVILLDQNGYQNGLAVEVPGQAAILRPGNTSAPLIFAVQQPSCFAIGGNVKFFYVLSPGLSGINTAFFGQIYADTSGDGSTWQFNNQTNFTSPYEFQVNEGSDVPSDATFPGYPAGYPATCSGANGAAATVSASPLAYFDQGANSYAVPTQFVISPGGLFFENQNYTNVPTGQGWPYVNVASWGVSEPPEPVVVGNLAPANYLGFLFESNPGVGLYRTRLVGFGNLPISGTVLTGGTFPSEDPSQVSADNMSVTFNGQDPLNNGMFYQATLTIPNDDPSQFTGGCLSYSISQAGTSTCTNDGVAMVSVQNGLVTIIMGATDTSGNQRTLVLFQQ